jgi:signal transduction histidine kinase
MGDGRDEKRPGNGSPGVSGVAIGRPVLVRAAPRRRPRGDATTSAFVTDTRRAELLSAVYVIGVCGATAAWLADSADIAHPAGMAALLSVVLLCAVGLIALRNHLPPYADDAAIVGSLLLITIGNLLCRLHVHPGLFTPYYVWVGFASPIWFSRRRAMVYVALAIVLSGIVALVDHSAIALAAWFTLVATIVVAFFTVESLTRALVNRERLVALGEMASVVSHELRNPLAAVKNSMFLVRHSMDGHLTPELDRALALADREVDKADAIINQFVAFVRPRQPLVAPVAIGEVVSEALETTPPPPGVRVDLDMAPVCTVVDRGHLVEILVNLLSNAYDAISGTGCVRVYVTARDSRAVVTVEDTGHGIDKASTERIFDPFYTTKHQGSGLGLAIVRRLLEANDGDISVTSQATVGTCFTVLLPLASSPARPARRVAVHDGARSAPS